MATIKGPITIKGPCSISDAVAKMVGGDTKKVKLPFTATGWKSTKMPDVEVEGIDAVKAYSLEEVQGVAVAEPAVATEPAAAKKEKKGE